MYIGGFVPLGIFEVKNIWSTQLEYVSFEALCPRDVRIVLVCLILSVTAPSRSTSAAIFFFKTNNISIIGSTELQLSIFAQVL